MRCSPTVRPPSTKTTASAISSRSPSRWLDTTIAVPARASSRSRSRSSTRLRGSRPDAGSSSSRTSGSCTTARDRPSRCFCPRDSTWTGESACSTSRAWSQQLLGALARARPAQPVGLPDELEVLPAGEVVVQPEHVRRPAHPRAHRVRLARRVVPGDADLAGVGHEQGGEHQHQRRLAGAVGADQPGDLAGRRGEVDAADRLDGAERAAHPARHHPGGRARVGDRQAHRGTVGPRGASRCGGARV